MATVQPVPAIVCSVLGESQGRSMLFRGRILSHDAVSGTYSLAITKSGPSGRSNITQGGGFASTAGAETFVGTATLSLEAGAHYDVRLVVTAGGETFTCTPLSGDRT